MSRAHQNERTNEISGILVVDKEKGMTSHDVVALVRKRFNLKKVGHAGTLDPNATGVLVLLIGSATKLSATLTCEDKKYRALMKLGEKTDSGDLTGKLIYQKDVSVGAAEINEVAKRFVGEIEQIPPMFSAKKIKGKRLYKLALKGEVVERPPVQITITSLDIISINIPEVEFDVSCSKGTYIRQLAEDMGEKLGCGAHLLELRRTASGDFNIDGALTVSKLKEMSEECFNESVKRV